MKRFVSAFLLLGGLLVAGGVWASVTYNATWSGNGGTATGSIVFSSDSVFTSGTSCGNFAACNITAVTVTVSGASAGNGTFVTADFNSNQFFIYLSGPVITSQNLVGQPNLNEFNLFNAAGSPTAPTGFPPVFKIRSDGGFGTVMTLTSLIPASSPAPTTTAQAVPSLSEWAQLMLGLMVISMLGWHWRKQQN